MDCGGCKSGKIGGENHGETFGGHVKTVCYKFYYVLTPQLLVNVNLSNNSCFTRKESQPPYELLLFIF